jgi:hypothetical protein
MRQTVVWRCLERMLFRVGARIVEGGRVASARAFSCARWMTNRRGVTEVVQSLLLGCRLVAVSFKVDARSHDLAAASQNRKLQRSCSSWLEGAACAPDKAGQTVWVWFHLATSRRTWRVDEPIGAYRSLDLVKRQARAGGLCRPIVPLVSNPGKTPTRLPTIP